MTKKKWLQKQLTNVKRQQVQWVEFADAIETVVNQFIEPYIDRLKRRNSLYDMDKEDLLEVSKEIRKKFPMPHVSDTDLPHTIVQRLDEIHFKKTKYPILSTIRREFYGMEVEWIQLYAPVDQERFPYGTMLIQEDKIDEFHDMTFDDFFLTSRGVIRIPINKIPIKDGNDGVSEDEILEFEKKVYEVICPLIPLKTVYDGQVYYIVLSVLDVPEKTYQSNAVSTTVCLNDQQEEMQHSSPTHTRVITEESQTAVIRAKPRMGAVSMDSIRLDRVL